MFPFVMFLGVALSIGVFMAVSISYEKRRAGELEALREGLGLVFQPADDGSLKRRLSNLPLFSEGKRGIIKNLLIGGGGEFEMAVFDYLPDNSKGRTSHASRQTMMAFRADALHVPAFELGGGYFLPGVVRAFAPQGIDLESRPEFSRKYVLRGNDEKAIRDLFDRRIAEYFERNEGICVQGNGDQLLVYRVARRLKPEEYKTFMEEGLQVFELFKRRD